MIYFDYDVSLPTSGRHHGKLKTGKNQTLILEFLNSGKDIAELRYAEGDYATSRTCQSAFIQAVKSLGLADKISVVLRGSRVFLVRR